MTFASRLFVGVINASRRGVEISLHADFHRGLKHVGVDQHGKHAQGLVVFDKSHAAHVCGQVVNRVRLLGGLLAGLLKIQIQDEIFHVVELLIPLVQGLDVHGTDFFETLPAQIGNKISADKTAAAIYHNQLIFHAHSHNLIECC